MKVAFVGSATEKTQVAMQAVKTMCGVMKQNQKSEWLCENLQFIDCKSGKEEQEKEILEKADILVMSFDQSSVEMEQYFERIPKYHEKTFYLIHNYWEQQQWNREAIQKTCRIREERLGILPYNQHFSNTCQKQNISSYIQQHWYRPQLQEKSFFHELAWISEKIIQQAERKRRADFFR